MVHSRYYGKNEGKVIMIDRNQCFVRAQDENGRWKNVDVLDLDDESFRRFVISILAKMQLIHIVRNENVSDRPLKQKGK
jgi:hypothetical protein